MKSYEKAKRPRKKLKRWQIIAIVGFSLLFIIATIVFIVLWHNAIFSENVLIISILVILLVWFGTGAYIMLKDKKGLK